MNWSTIPFPFLPPHPTLHEGARAKGEFFEACFRGLFAYSCEDITLAWQRLESPKGNEDFVLVKAQERRLVFVRFYVGAPRYHQKRGACASTLVTTCNPFQNRYS